MLNHPCSDSRSETSSIDHRAVLRKVGKVGASKRITRAGRVNEVVRRRSNRRLLPSMVYERPIGVELQNDGGVRQVLGERTCDIAWFVHPRQHTTLFVVRQEHLDPEVFDVRPEGRNAHFLDHLKRTRVE